MHTDECYACVILCYCPFQRYCLLEPVLSSEAALRACVRCKIRQHDGEDFESVFDVSEIESSSCLAPCDLEIVFLIKIYDRLASIFRIFLYNALISVIRYLISYSP